MSKSEVRDINLKKYLNNQRIDTIELVGVINYVILNKTIFKKNDDVHIFVKKSFNLSFPGYLIRSRTLMAARVSKYIFNNEIKNIDNIFGLIEEQILSNSSEVKEKIIKNKKRKLNENDKLDKWLQEPR